MGIAEITCGLHYLEAVTGKDGNPAHLNHLASHFEQGLNFSFGDIYDRQDAIFRRKACNLTKGLDALRAAIIRESRRRNNS